MWNLWKEHNRRFFLNSFQLAQQVASRAKDDIDQRKSAFCFFFAGECILFEHLIFAIIAPTPIPLLWVLQAQFFPDPGSYG
jgi:hypothetical protein